MMMKQLYLIALREFKTALISYSFLVIAISFHLFTSIYTFVLYPFFVAQQASLSPLFEFTPLLQILLLPAMVMGSFVEEKKSGHLELLLTFRLSDAALIFGKFSGIFCLYLLMLLPVWFYGLGVSFLGHLDWGIFSCSVIGLSLCGMLILAIGLLMSLIANGLIAAWAFTFFPSITLYLINRLSLQVDPRIAKIIQTISLEWHYSQFCKGVLDLRSMLFFLILTALILTFAYMHLSHRQMKLNVF
jgi:ABC-2 type transport system permease protein